MFLRFSGLAFTLEIAVRCPLTSLAQYRLTLHRAQKEAGTLATQKHPTSPLLPYASKMLPDPKSSVSIAAFEF